MDPPKSKKSKKSKKKELINFKKKVTLITQPFRNAIALERQADTLLADSYIQYYNPKKLAKLVKLGIAIFNLVPSDIRNDIGGNIIFDLKLDSAVKNDKDISLGPIKKGDIVIISKMKDAKKSSKKKNKNKNKKKKKNKKKNKHEPVESKDDNSIDHELVGSKDDSSIDHEPVESKDDNSIAHEPVGSKDDSSIDHEPVESKDDSSIDHEPVESKDDNSIDHELVGSKDDNSIAHEPVGSKDDSSIDHELVGSKDDNSIDHELVGSKDDNSIDHELVGSKDENSIEGVVVKVSRRAITISVEAYNMDENSVYYSEKLWIMQSSNSTVYDRMTDAMDKLDKTTQDNEIINLLVGISKSFRNKNLYLTKKNFFNQNLNQSQTNAIRFAIFKFPISIIHGPPGTGKTYTLIELIKQLSFNHQERVLVCGPSNISVDTILERLSSTFDENKKINNPEYLIRIGHLARILASNQCHSLDFLSKTGESVLCKLLKTIESDISKTVEMIKNCINPLERETLWWKIKYLRKKLERKKRKVVKELIANSKVVFSTLHGAGAPELTSLYNDRKYKLYPLFDTIIIDEVSQSLEPQCWIPIVNHLGFKRLVIAGDNLQLPPTIKSKDDKKKLKNLNLDNVANLEITLFDRLVNELEGNNYKKLLDTQYRMNEKIMKFPSKEMYDNLLKADESVKNINLGDFKVEGDDCSELVWYDTQGGDFPERADKDSKYNEMEAKVVVKHLQSLLDTGLKPKYIGIISPYSAQVTLLKKKVQNEFGIEGIEISTVDGFQGREKEVIIISLVRSNVKWEVGFLRDKRRLNVAMTRPKRQLCVVGDLEMLKNSEVQFLEDWANFVENGGDYDLRSPKIDDF